MVDYFFPPNVGPAVRRTLGLARSLPKLGWSPIVLTSRPDGAAAYEALSPDTLFGGVTVCRARSPDPVKFAKKIVKRFKRTASFDLPPGARWLASRRTRVAERWVLFPDRYLSWLPFALGAASPLIRDHAFDVIYSTFSDAMSSHLVGYLLKKQSGRPWVADFQDPWTENYFYDIPTAAHARVARWLEAVVLRNADCITVTTERHRQILLRQYPFLQNHRVKVVPLGFHEEDFEKTVLPSERTKFTLTHFGNFHSTRSPVALLSAVAGCCVACPSFALETRISFLGTFDVDSWRALSRIVNDCHLRTIVDVRGTVEYGEGLRYLKDSDVLLLIMDDSGWGRNMTPCKLFDYLPTGRPILAMAPEGTTATVVRNAAAGLVVDPGDVSAIESTLLYFYDRWKQGSLLFDSDARYISSFEWKSVTREFTRVLDDVMSHAAGPPQACGS